VRELVADARERGATFLTGGEAPGGDNYFFPVTLVSEIADGARLVDEEQFGPVLPIIRYSDLDQAVEKANALDYGLCASVWGGDRERAHRVASRLEAGTVYVNKHAEI